MPRVYLTEKQRKEAAEQDAIKRMHQLITDSLAVIKNRENLTDNQLAKRFNVGPKTVAKLHKMESANVELGVLLRIIYILSLEVRPRNQA